MKIKAPDFEKIIANRPPRVCKPFVEKMKFNGVSLADYIKVCMDSGVSFVSVAYIGEYSIDGLLHHEEDSKTLDRLNSDRFVSQNQSKNMIRFDSHAPSNLKIAMSDGLPKPPNKVSFELDRDYTILMDYPSETIKLYRRPWINTMKYDGYPVEFRVFVEDNKVVAISNYYPQMTLPKDKFSIFISLCLKHANKMVETMIAQDKIPQYHMAHCTEENLHWFDKVNCTLDFILDEHGVVRFLEGGPPSPQLAHPCCFYNPETFEIDPIRGIALGIGVKQEFAELALR